ncbi:hypothetical protein PP707_06340, partial [Acetobacter pasteurianus]|nr:hypothetical protein [Acetobacter pasteurianus]
MVVCAAENRGKDQGGKKNKTRDGVEGPTVKKWFFHFIYICYSATHTGRSVPSFPLSEYLENIARHRKLETSNKM